MGVWSTYEARLGISADYGGDPKRYSALCHLQDRTKRKITSSLSYKDVTIDGVSRNVAITEGPDSFDTKYIISVPGEDLPHGSVVEWENSFWLITEVNAHNEVYNKGKITRCNYYLKWIDDNGDIIGRWCIVEDGTKYLIGEKSADIMSIGDARIAVTIGKDSDTNKLNRGRRFLIDDMDSTNVLAYQITKPNKLYNVYNGKGVFRFILNEVNLTDDDNVELRIADYYNWAPKTPPLKPNNQVDATLEEIVDAAIDKSESANDDNKGVWL